MSEENDEMLDALLSVLFDEDEIRLGRCFGLAEIHLQSIFNEEALKNKLVFNLTTLLKAFDTSFKSVRKRPQKHLQMMVHMLLMMHQLHQRLLVVDENTIDLMEIVSNFKMFCINRLVRLVHLLGRTEVDLGELEPRQWEVVIDVLENCTLMPQLAINALKNCAKK